MQFFFFLFYTFKTYFFFLTLLFLQNTHISLSIIHIYSNKICISFTLSSLSPTQYNHTTTIIKQPPSSTHSTQPYEIPKQIIKQIIKNGSKPKSHRSERQEGYGALARTCRILSPGLGSLDHGLLRTTIFDEVWITEIKENSIPAKFSDFEVLSINLYESHQIVGLERPSKVEMRERESCDKMRKRELRWESEVGERK